MRTTLDIDDDVLLAVKEIARREAKSAGAVTSSILRKAMSEKPSMSEDSIRETQSKYGFKPFSKRGGVVTNSIVDRLKEETGQPAL